MKTIEIKHRWTGQVIYTAEVEDDDETAIRTALARANLAGANLARANLARANLDGAYLAGANLARANLDGAYLARANLDGANLAGANLARANLDGAYLAGAYHLPEGFVATDPVEPYAVAMAQSLSERAKRYRERHPEVPVVEQLDVRILGAISNGNGRLYMGSWHSDEPECGTTHCRGGWAIHLAGKPGYDLERQVGVERAAAMIYTASTGRAPHFYATDEQAIQDIKECAAAQAAEAQGSK